MNLETCISKDGYKILKVIKQEKVNYLGSRYNQKREIEKFINSFNGFYKNDIYIVFGLSFGEHIIELLKTMSKDSKILVIELNNQLIQYWKSNEKLNNLLKKDNLILASSIDEVEDFFLNYVTELNVENIQIKFYCKYDILYAKEIEIFAQKIKDEVSRIIINRNTKLYFGEKWFELLLDNLKYIVNGIPVNELKNTYKDTPAIIVSAGPSLSKNIEQLKDVKNSLIISGGRTLRSLKEINVEPDYLCVYDPGDISYKLVEGYIDNVKCPLIFYEGTNAEVVRNHQGKKIFSSSSKFINELVGIDVQNLSAGGSVAHCMTMFSIYMGCNPIIFIGQDFAYTDDKMHAECAEGKKKKSIEEYKKDDDIFVDDINGNKVRTSMVLNRFRIAMENIINYNKGITFINATEGGALIKGTQNKSLKDVINLIDKKKKCIKTLALENKCDKSNMKIKLKGIYADFNKYISLYNRRKILIEENNYDKVEKINMEIEEIISKLDILEPILFIIDYNLEKKEQLKISIIDSENEILRKNNEKNNSRYAQIKLYIEKYIGKLSEIITNIE